MEKKAERVMMRMLFRGKDDAFSLLETVLFIFIISMLLLGLDAAVVPSNPWYVILNSTGIHTAYRVTVALFVVVKLLTVSSSSYADTPSLVVAQPPNV